MQRNFEEFFRENYGRVVRALAHTGTSSETAADCAQEAFVRAYARWPLLRLYREPLAWVHRVARNLCIDAHRRALRDGQVRSAMSERDLPPADDAIVGLDVRQAIDALPEQQRRATELYYLREHSTDEGARALGISGGAFRFHLTRARAALRERLDDDGDGVDRG